VPSRGRSRCRRRNRGWRPLLPVILATRASAPPWPHAGEHAGFGRGGIGTVPHHVNAGMLRLQRPWADQNPAVLSQATRQHYLGHAMLGHSQVQIKGHLALVVEQLRAALWGRSRQCACSDGRRCHARQRPRSGLLEVSGEDGTGADLGSTKLILQLFLTSRALK
jgi:hypothetical protein